MRTRSTTWNELRETIISNIEDSKQNHKELLIEIAELNRKVNNLENKFSLSKGMAGAFYIFIMISTAIISAIFSGK